MTYTCEEIAQIFGVEKDAAYGFIRACIAFGVCKQEGVRSIPGKKGKGSNLYGFEENATEVLRDRVQQLNGKKG